MTNSLDLVTVNFKNITARQFTGKSEFTQEQQQKFRLQTSNLVPTLSKLTGQGRRTCFYMKKEEMVKAMMITDESIGGAESTIDRGFPLVPLLQTG